MRRLALLIALFIGIGSLHASPDGRSWREKGHDLLAAGRFAEAEQAFQRAIKDDPDDRDAWQGYRSALRRETPKAVPPGRDERMNRLLEDLRRRRAGAEKPPLASRPPVAPRPLVAPMATPAAALPGSGPKTPPERFEAIDVKEVLAEAKVPTDLRLGIDDGRRRPWKHFAIRRELLASKDLSLRVLNELKREFSFSFRRRVRSAVSYVITVWNSKLYNALASAIGAEKGWSKSEADKNYTLLCKHIPDKYEFRIAITNHRAPRLILDTADVHLRTFLTDDRGHRWNPVKTTPMGKARLTGRGEYTVWFPRYDEMGRDIATVGHGRMYMNIQGIENGRDDVRIPFKALLLRQ